VSREGRRALAEVLGQAEQVLREAGVWAPRGDAEALAAAALGCLGSALPPGEPVSAEIADRIREMVGRRAARVPLAHITGRARLGGIEVAVGQGVFVPRRQSEPFVVWALHAVSRLRRPVVIDLCTGSAAIALAVAHARPDATVRAVDVEPTSLDCARRNARDRAGAGDTPVTVVAGDVTDPTLLAELAGSVDLVLANPPYVPEGVTLLPEWSVHHPSTAIYGGPDGLDLIRHVVRRAETLLRPGGGSPSSTTTTTRSLCAACSHSVVRSRRSKVTTIRTACPGGRPGNAPGPAWRRSLDGTGRDRSGRDAPSRLGVRPPGAPQCELDPSQGGQDL